MKTRWIARLVTAAVVGGLLGWGFAVIVKGAVCPHCDQEIEITLSKPAQPEPPEPPAPVVPREFVRYVWGAHINGVPGGSGRFVILSADRLARFRPDFVIWNSCGTAAMIRDELEAGGGKFGDEATFNYARDHLDLVTSGAFMRVHGDPYTAVDVAAQKSRWDRCNVKHVVYNPEWDWTPGRAEMKAYVGPDVEFILGNVGWGPNYPNPEYVAKLRASGDALEHYYRGYGPGRHWLNFKWRCAFLDAVCRPVGKKYYVGVQPWNDQGLGSNPLAEYTASLGIVAQHADGILGWGWEDMTDEQIDAWNNQQALARPVPTHSIILIGDERIDPALFRVAHWAGIECEAVLPGQEPRLPVFDPFPQEEHARRAMIGYVSNFHNGVVDAAWVEAHEKEIAAAWLGAGGVGA